MDDGRQISIEVRVNHTDLLISHTAPPNFHSGGKQRKYTVVPEFRPSGNRTIKYVEVKYKTYKNKLTNMLRSTGRRYYNYKLNNIKGVMKNT